MRRFLTLISGGVFAAVSFIAGAQPARAIEIDICEASAYLSWDGLAGTIEENSIESLFCGSGVTDFASNGFTTTFTNLLDVDGTGELTWSVTNDTGGTLNDVTFIVYLNADILDAFLDPFNEYASFEGFGSFDGWEVDDPDFGDILANIAAGLLDDTNALPDDFFIGDAAIALSFNIGTLEDGQQFVASFFITEGGGLEGITQIDADSAESFNFNGSVTVAEVIAMAEPGTMWLLFSSLLLLGIAVRRRA